MGRSEEEPRATRRQDGDRELSEELEFHLRKRAEELEREGVSPAEARRRAEDEFGDLQATLAYCRAEDRRRRRLSRFSRSLRAAWDELELARRSLTRRPAGVVAAGSILGLAVALNALVFTMVRGVLLAPLPFSDPDRVAVVAERTQQYGLSRLSYPVLDAWRRGSRSLEELAAYVETERTLVTATEPLRVRGAAVTAGFFGLLDRPFLSGRPLPAEAHRPDAPSMAVVTERLWRRLSGGDPSFLERPLRMDGQDYTVSGVVRDRAGFPEDVDVWLALEPSHAGLMEIAGAKILVGLARLGAGADLGSAAQELGEIARRVEGGGQSASAVPVADVLVGDVRTPLLLLQAAVLLVLLAACANAGGMLLARGVRRRAELAVRVSLGSGAARLAVGLLFEGVILGAGAGLVGLALAAVTLGPAMRLVPDDLPRTAGVALDPTVALFALGLAVATGVVTALVPALSGARTSPGPLLRDSSAGTAPWLRRLLEGFVVAQMALAVLLTAGAGLLLKSFVATVSEDPGFDASHVTVVDVSLPEHRYPDAPSRRSFANALLERAAGLPGASAVALGRNLPISGSNMTSPLQVDGADQTGAVQVALVSAGYFDVMRIPILDGLGFGDADREGGPPVLVVDSGVRTSEGGSVDVGSRAHSYFGTDAGPDGYREVVGVAGAVRHDGLRAAPAPVAYEPFFQKGGAAAFSLLVRSDAPTRTVAAAAQALVRSLDAELPVDRVGTMTARISRSVAEPRFYTVVLSLFGALAVLLALAGCQAGLAHRVASRRREIGLRMALGASRPGVRGMVLRRGLALTAAGAAVGVLLALPATRLLESQLYGVSTGDPVTYAGIVLLLFAAAALASDLPARRASSVDPMEVLRE